MYGGQIGYNWQIASWVFGIEAQFEGANLTKTVANPFTLGFGSMTAKVDSYYTVAGRLGYAVDSWLPYIKAGYAGARLKTTDFDVFGDRLASSNWRSGFIVGGGLEYGITQNWIVGVEYNYMDFGSKTFTANSTGPFVGGNPPDTFKDKLTVQSVTGRLSYKFGGPLVARY